jgi:exopolyphosphatase/guanosine-5'-triphosphate,3'-diphosphate pyrophosphatase
VATRTFPSDSDPKAGAKGGDGIPGQERRRGRRRKRRRGRKVFARQEIQETRPAPAAPPVAEIAEAPAPKEAGRRTALAARGGNGQQTYAALDLGTNNCRLLVAVPARPGQFRVIDAFSRIVRLGEGLSATGRLSEAAMERSIEALRICAAKLSLRPGGRRRLIATEACRAAANGAEFLRRVHEETGLSLEIVDRETEARLAVSGCSSLVEHGTSGVVLFDIGGGSSEIVLIDLSRRHTPRLARHIVAWTSLPVGVVSLAEKFGGREVTPGIFAAMVDEVGRMLDAFGHRGALGEIASGPDFHLLGTSGTVTTLAGVHLGLERYDRRRVDGLWLTDRETDAIVDRLVNWSFEERVANACIGADRADLVLAGCAILEAIRRAWPASRLRVADRGLREGMLTEMMIADGVWRRDRQYARTGRDDRR